MPRGRQDLIRADEAGCRHRTDEAAARQRFIEFTAVWGQRYPGIIRLWDNAWAEFVPFLAFEVEVRWAILSTNAIESLNARFRVLSAPRPFPERRGRLVS